MRALGMAVLVLALAIGLTGQTAAFFPDADVVNQFAPVWLTIGVAAAIVALVSYRTGTQAIVAMAGGALLIALAARMVLPEFLHRTPCAADGRQGPDLTLIQFNAMKDNRDPAAASRWIIAQHADVVTIEEARQSSELMRRLRPVYRYQMGCLDHDRCSTAVLTRMAPLAIVPLARGDPDNRGGLSAVGAIVAAREEPVLVIATHFNRPWPFKGYDRSIRALSEKLDAIPRMPTVLAGDFNMTPWTFAMGRQDRLIGMARLDHAIPTWPATFANGISLPILPIDHVYARGLCAIGIGAGPPIGSDHLPLRAELMLDRAPGHCA